MEESSPRKKSVLVADDNLDAACLLEDMLSERYLVATALTGHQAIAAMEGVLFDVAILDLRYPDMGISDFIVAVARLPQRPPIVVLTGWDLREVMPMVEPIAPHVVLQKPCSFERLFEILNALLGT